MDIMLQQPNHSVNSELDILSAANETLEELITAVENLLRNTELKGSSELPEGMQVFCEKSQDDLIQNVEYESGLNCQQPDHSVKEEQMLNGNNQDGLLVSIESQTSDRDGLLVSIESQTSDRDGLLVSIESETSDRDELITNDQSDLSATEEQIVYGNKCENSLVCATCMTVPSLEKLDHSIKEGQLFCLGSQEDFFTSAEYQIDSNLGQSDLCSSEEQLLHESNQDVNLINEDFVDALENIEDFDGSNGNSNPDDSSINELFVDDNVENDSDEIIINVNDDAEEEMDPDDGNEVVHALMQTSEEIGDQSDFDFDEIELIEMFANLRIVNLLENSNGMGDYSLEDDDDDE